MAISQTQHEALFEDLYGFFTRFVQRSTGNLTMLDFGCGRIGYSRYYCRHFRRCIALDIVDYSKAYAKTDIENIDFVHYDGKEIPLPDRSVDVVISHSVLEHVRDESYSLGEINRVLKEGGFAYLTVSPLYFSPSGSHLHLGETGATLHDWEHLDPGSPYYIGIDGVPTCNSQGHFLNKLTSARLLAAVGEQPWEILTYKLKAMRAKRLPDFLRTGELNRVDLFVREFRLIVRKDFAIVADEIVMP
jgi:SAM-dependent methyltransferase